MQIREMEFKNAVRKQVLEYKPDGNTPVIRNHDVYPAIPGIYYRVHPDRYAGQNVEILVDFDNFLYEAEYIQGHNDDAYLKGRSIHYAQFAGRDKFVEMVVEKKKVGAWLKNVYMLGLRAMGENELADECDEIHKKQWDERNERYRIQEEEAKAKREEEERIRNSEIETTIREAEAIIKNGGEVENENVHGQKIILRLMDKHGINPPLRTRGWLNQKLAIARFNENTVGYSYYRVNKAKGSDTAYKYLFELMDVIRKEAA